jgi:hypothetical protein
VTTSPSVTLRFHTCQSDFPEFFFFTYASKHICQTVFPYPKKILFDLHFFLGPMQNSTCPTLNYDGQSCRHQGGEVFIETPVKTRFFSCSNMCASLQKAKKALQVACQDAAFVRIATSSRATADDDDMVEMLGSHCEEDINIVEVPCCNLQQHHERQILGMHV